MEAEASLYIHIPFCWGRCDYCDFYSLPVNPEDPLLDRYVDALMEDLQAQFTVFAPQKVPSAYIGGGTPSVLGAKRLGRLLDFLATLLPPGEREFTLEANPESADAPLLEAALAGGVNRISVGVQSFQDDGRRLVGRRGGGALAEERLEMASALFPGKLTVDLMTGLPGQDEKMVQDDIERALLHHPAHVSLYALTLEPETPLAEKIARKVMTLPQGDEADRLWLAGARALEAAGYEQYEVSNFARDGKRSRHNIRYWRMESWLGAGSSASGTIIDEGRGRGFRYTLAPDLPSYLTLPKASTLDALFRNESLYIIEELDAQTLLKEIFLMGFRYIEGPDPQKTRRLFSRDLEALIPQSLARWRRRGLLREDKAALTQKGLLFLNPFLLDVFSELDEAAPIGFQG